MSVRLSHPRRSLRPYVTPLYQFCGVFVRLHIMSLDFLPSMQYHDIIPLCLTSENRVALDSLAVSHATDEQLHKVMAFGEQAVTARPLSL